MNKELPNTYNSLLSLLGDLKIKLENDEISKEEYADKEKLILNKLNNITKEKTFNGSDLLVTDEKILLTINNLKPKNKYKNKTN